MRSAVVPCQFPRKTLSRWIDDDLTSSESNKTRQHLDSCSACRATLERMTATDRHVKDLLRNITPPHSLSVDVVVSLQKGKIPDGYSWSLPMGRWLKPILVTVIIILLICSNMNNPQESSLQESRKTAISVEGSDSELLHAIKPELQQRRCDYAEISYSYDYDLSGKLIVITNKRGARLPTETEWEHAARGPDSRGQVEEWSTVLSLLAGPSLATTGQDGTVRVWDAGSDHEPHTLRGHSSTVWASARGVMLSPELMNAEYGNLLNCADQILKSFADRKAESIWTESNNDTDEDIVYYDESLSIYANEDKLWPGSLVNGHSVGGGVLDPIPVSRAPAEIALTIVNGPPGVNASRLLPPSLAAIWRSELGNIWAVRAKGTILHEGNISPILQGVCGRSGMAKNPIVQLSWPTDRESSNESRCDPLAHLADNTNCGSTSNKVLALSEGAKRVESLQPKTVSLYELAFRRALAISEKRLGQEHEQAEPLYRRALSTSHGGIHQWRHRVRGHRSIDTYAAGSNRP